MKVLRDVKIRQIKTAVSIGFFDGVHIGHQEVILKAVKSDFLPVVLTFDFSNVAPESKKGFKYIYSDFMKFSLIENLGVRLTFCPFFEKIQNLSFLEFFHNILIEKLNAKLIICGENLKFGKDRKADVKILEELVKMYDVFLDVVPLSRVEGVVVSSKRIRKEIENGNFPILRKLLGREFYIEFKIEKIFAIEGNFFFFKHIKKEMAFMKDGKYLANLFVNGMIKRVLVVVEKLSGDFFLKIKVLSYLEKNIIGYVAKLVFLY